jgi:peptidase M28-like protein
MSSRLRLPATAARAAIVIAVLGLSASGPATAARRNASGPRGVDQIEQGRLKADLSFIAADELEGRDTPSRGLDVAARYIAARLQAIGLKPGGGDGSYFQRFDTTRRTADPAKAALAVGDRAFSYGDEFLVNTPGSAEGRLVYVGHGYVVKKKNLDAYANADVKGKIVVAHAGYPEGVSRVDLRGESGPNTWESPASYAARHGALGVVLVPDYPTLAGWRTSRDNAEKARGSLTVDAFQKDRPAPVPVVVASMPVVAAIFLGESISASDVVKLAQDHKPHDPVVLSEKKTLKIDVAAKVDTLRTQNVVAIYEGSDPALKGEYVALGAHYDHIGLATSGSDRINNGADDDGSGTVALLNMAEALVRGNVRTRRSWLFVWHAGEERGLWGSRYFVEHPTVPIDKIVTQLNVDMIGRSKAPNDSAASNASLTGPNETYVIGSKMMSTTLGALSERVNRDYLDLGFNYKYDDPNDPSRFFFRSDHYNYAKKGIPIIFYFSGVHADYHRVSDEIGAIDFAKLERVARTIYATAYAVAELPARPVVDRQLPAQLTTEE